MSVVDYLSVNISCKPEFTEIIIAELAELNYDSMMETDAGLEAYIKPAVFNEEDLKTLFKRYKQAEISYTVEEVQERNWNEEWEKNYDPISVEDKILVRATFHQALPEVEHEIIINPRMSFGTGHHDTTYLMLKSQLEIDHKNKRVLDAGSGTGILAIMAEKLGANDIIAYDNNSWSAENAPENVGLNHCKHIKVMEGTIDTLNLNGQFDIILANINKNVLLDEMSSYIDYLNANGTLLLSGFYKQDEEDMINAARNNQLELISKATRNNWCSLRFQKK